MQVLQALGLNTLAGTLNIMKPSRHNYLFAIIGLFIAIAITGCSDKSTNSSKDTDLRTVGRFHVAGEAAVNTWWVHAAGGLIVIDFQRDTDSAQKAIEIIRDEGRPVKALLLTHAHPDHIGGIAQFKKAFPKLNFTDPVQLLMKYAATRWDIRSLLKKSSESLLHLLIQFLKSSLSLEL